MLLLAALVMRLVVPTGYMIGEQDGRPSIILCSGVAAPMAVAEPAMAGMHHGGGGDHAPQPAHDKPEQPCAFAGLSVHALGSADPALLVAMLAFVMALALRPGASPAPALRLYWRPPSQGPPATF